MSRPEDQALEVLRTIWSAQEPARGTSTDPGGDASGGRSCKRMQDVGFDAMAGSDGDLRAAWRETLRREGKLDSAAGSVADLVLGPAQVR